MSGDYQDHTLDWQGLALLVRNWQHRDGEGYALRFDLIPTTPDDIVLRKPKPKTEAGA